jgi:predicted CXXCH cytochrome family protein
MKSSRQRAILWTLILSILLVPGVLAQETTGDATPIEPTGDNGYCSICHSQPGRQVILADGSVLNLYASPEMLANSVHAAHDESVGLGCLDCHGADAFPHSGPQPASNRVVTMDSAATCTSCHTRSAEELAGGLHAMALDAGNMEAAVCSDCHGAHDVQATTAFVGLVATVCGDCHVSTLDEWQASPHAELDKLGCTSCHNHHSQTLRLAQSPTALCLNCHEKVEPSFAHVAHLDVENPIGCEDCHMYREAPATDAFVSIRDVTGTGHSMAVPSTTCLGCHENLEAGATLDNSATIATTSELQTIESLESELGQIRAEGENTAAIRIVQGIVFGLVIGGVLMFLYFRMRPGRYVRDEDSTA